MDALFPIYCFGCQKEGCWVCTDCHSVIKIAPLNLCPGCGLASAGGMTHVACRGLTSLDALVSPYHYANPVLRALLKEYKYHGAVEIEKILSGFASAAVFKTRTFFPGKAVVVPMPLHPSRERMRGFNQSMSLTKSIAQTLSFAVAEPVSRVRRTSEQALLTTTERNINCREAFKSINITGEVVLVDDVVTSGATMNAAAKALKMAGAARVIGFALAHGSGDRLRS